jgi:transcriptional regulator with XRE-family HTH domain
MQSTKKTTIAVLRAQMGITAEKFAELIRKSLFAVNSLETGRLKLSEETAHRISEETGVVMEWLLDADPDEPPFWFDHADGRKRPWDKLIFEQIQASKLESHASYKDRRPAWRLVRALRTTGRWVSIYCWAEREGKRELAEYLLGRFLDQLAKRLGTDDAGATKLCQNAELRLKDGTQWSFQPEAGQLYLRLESKL